MKVISVLSGIFAAALLFWAAVLIGLGDLGLKPWAQAIGGMRLVGLYLSGALLCASASLYTHVLLVRSE